MIGSDPARRQTLPWRRFQSLRCPSGIQLFKNLTFLAPEKKIRVFVDTSRSYFARKQPSLFTATIRYQDAEGRRFKAEIPHNVGIYRDFPFIRHVEPDRRGELPSPRIDTGR